MSFCHFSIMNLKFIHCSLFMAYISASEPHTCSVDSSDKYGISVSISGNTLERPLLNISSFSSLTLDDIASITLENVEIERKEFVELLGSFEKLVSIELYNVVVVNNENDDIKIHQRALLPILRIYSIDVESTTTFKASDYLSSLIFFRESTDTEGKDAFSTLGKLALVSLSVKLTSSDPTCLQCSMKIDNTQLFLSGVKDVGIWPMLQNSKFCFQDVKIVNSVISETTTDFPCATAMNIANNFMVEGTLEKVVRGAPNMTSLQISVKHAEAIDIKALPSATLKVLNIRGISLRWASGGSVVHFEKLSEMNMVAGDLDLDLIYAPQLKTLELAFVKLWSNNISSIAASSKNLDFLLFNCQGFRETCPTVELSLLPHNLGKLILVGVQVRKEWTNFKMHRLAFLTIGMSHIDHSVFHNFTNFPALKVLTLTSERVIPASLMQNVFEAPALTGIIFKYPLGMSRTENREYANMFNQTEGINYTGKTEVLFFIKSSTGWRRRPGPITDLEVDERILTRFSRILKTLNLAPRNYFSFLTGFYYGYSIGLYTICSLGILGNILSIYIFSRKAMRSSTSVILIGLGISDLLYLLTSFLTINEFRLLLEIQSSPSPFNLYFAYPLNKTMNTAAVYLTVLINVERFVAVRFPLKAKLFLDVKKAIRVTVGIFVFAFLFNVTRWFESISWEYSASSINWSAYFPHQLLNYPTYILIYHRIFWYSVMYVLPFGTMVGINIIIYLQLRKSRKTRREMVHQNTAAGGKEEKSLTRMLLTVVLVFLICNATSAIIIWTLIIRHDPDIVETLACFPVILNSSLNVLIYCITGQKFKTEFVKAFQFLWQGRRRVPGTTSVDASNNTRITSF